MRKLLLSLLYFLLANYLDAQNVGIGTLLPNAKLEIISDGNTTGTRALIIKNSDTDTMVWVNNAGRTMLGGVANLTHTLAVFNRLNPSYPQVGIIASVGTLDPLFPAGSTSRLSFYNDVHSANQYEIDSYTGSEIAKQYMQISYWPTFVGSARRNLIHFKPSGQVGIGTDVIAGKMQINHRATEVSPTLLLKDSANGGILQFQNSGSLGRYTLLSTIDATGVGAASFFDIKFNNSFLMTIKGDGNVGIGNFNPASKLAVNGNTSITGVLNVTGEVNRTSSGGANMLPIAYGNVSNTGVLNTGSDNVTVSKTGTGFYNVTITGEAYSILSYVTMVTPTGLLALISSTGSGSNQLIVRICNLSGVSTDGGFDFVVYKK